jgi:hypothetical protein
MLNRAPPIAAALDFAPNGFQVIMVIAVAFRLTRTGCLARTNCDWNRCAQKL